MSIDSQRDRTSKRELVEFGALTECRRSLGLDLLQRKYFLILLAKQIIFAIKIKRVNRILFNHYLSQGGKGNVGEKHYMLAFSI
jgi:hypothetical protein